MLFRRIGLLGVAAALVLASAMGAEASPITYEFTVTATAGPLTGTIETGTFTYDSSIVVPGTLLSQTNLLADFDFAWNGTTYDEFTANTGWLRWDAAGNLSAFGIGTNCDAFSCVVGGEIESWFLGGSGFTYSVGLGSIYPGTVSFAAVDAVPEPASSLTLLAFGFAGLAVRRWRQRKA